MNIRRIIYLTNARLPTEKAHGIAAMKLAEAFAEQGVEVILIHPWRLNPIREDPYHYYGVRRNFSIHTLPSFDFLWLGFGARIFFPIQLVSFSIIAMLYLLVRYRLWNALSDAVVFSHDHIPLFFASFVTPYVFYDIHDYPLKNIFFARVLRSAVGCSIQTRWKQHELKRDFGVAEDTIVYWPNGTDISRFDISISREEARNTLGLVSGRKIALYAGSLQSWKGVDTLIAAAHVLPDNIAVYIVGGDDQSIRELETKNSKLITHKLTFVGQRPWREIPMWLKAADVLVLPNTGRDEISVHYTSPMKLFEYMASNRPIVASDIPSVREIVDESMVFFARADDPHSFSYAIQRATIRSRETDERVQRARHEVGRFTWMARAEKLLAAMRKGL